MPKPEAPKNEEAPEPKSSEEILGFAKDSNPSKEEVAKAYKELAKKYTGKDEPDAEKFDEVVKAFLEISDRGKVKETEKDKDEEKEGIGSRFMSALSAVRRQAEKVADKMESGDIPFKKIYQNKTFRKVVIGVASFVGLGGLYSATQSEKPHEAPPVVAEDKPAEGVSSEPKAEKKIKQIEKLVEEEIKTETGIDLDSLMKAGKKKMEELSKIHSEPKHKPVEPEHKSEHKSEPKPEIRKTFVKEVKPETKKVVKEEEKHEMSKKDEESTKKAFEYFIPESIVVIDKEGSFLVDIGDEECYKLGASEIRGELRPIQQEYMAKMEEIKEIKSHIGKKKGSAKLLAIRDVQSREKAALRVTKQKMEEKIRECVTLEKDQVPEQIKKEQEKREKKIEKAKTVKASKGPGVTSAERRARATKDASKKYGK